MALHFHQDSKQQPWVQRQVFEEISINTLTYQGVAADLEMQRRADVAAAQPQFPSEDIRTKGVPKQKRLEPGCRILTNFVKFIRGGIMSCPRFPFNPLSSLWDTDSQGSSLMQTIVIVVEMDVLEHLRLFPTVTDMKDLAAVLTQIR